MVNERDLVQKILAGDAASQRVFYEENAKRLYPICVHFLGYQDPEAEDIVQEAFLIGFKKLREFEFRSSLYTWLAHICVNLCYERLRRRKRVLVSLESDLEKLSLPQAGDLAANQLAEEEKRERMNFLEKLMRSMSEKCRNILELREKKGESYIAIARILKIAPGTVMSQLARCREALKQLAQNERSGL